MHPERLRWSSEIHANRKYLFLHLVIKLWQLSSNKLSQTLGTWWSSQATLVQYVQYFLKQPTSWSHAVALMQSFESRCNEF